MSCSTFFCMGSAPTASSAAREELDSATVTSADLQADGISRTRSIDPDGAKGETPRKTDSPKGVASLFDADEKPVQTEGETEEAPATPEPEQKDTAKAPKKKEDPTDDADIQTPPSVISKASGARTLFAGDVVKEDYGKLRQTTSDNRHIARLMEENIRKEFQISALEASLEAHNRNPKMWDQMMEEEIAQLKANQVQRESDLLQKITAFENRVAYLEAHIEKKDLMSEKLQREHDQEIMAFNLISERQNEDFQDRLGQVEAAKASVMETLNTRMEEAEQHKSQILSTMTAKLEEAEMQREEISTALMERVAQLNAAQARVMMLENEMRLRDLMKEANLNKADSTVEEVTTEEKVNDQESAAAVTISTATTEPVHTMIDAKSDISAAMMKASQKTEEEDDTQSRLNAAFARLAQQAAKVGVDVDDVAETDDADGATSILDNMIDSKRAAEEPLSMTSE